MEPLGAMILIGVDSCAGASVLPTKMYGNFPVTNHPTTGTTYEASNGAAIVDEGRRTTSGKLRDKLEPGRLAQDTVLLVAETGVAKTPTVDPPTEESLAHGNDDATMNPGPAERAASQRHRSGGWTRLSWKR